MTPNEMTTERIKAIQERAEKATEIPANLQFASHGETIILCKTLRDANDLLLLLWDPDFHIPELQAYLRKHNLIAPKEQGGDDG
jgi:hypothetical protein